MPLTAKELKDKYLKDDVKDKIGVIAIGESFWYHVHDDEEMPKDLTIALHPREEENG